METKRFIVYNMKCMGCVNIVKNGLSQIEGISEVYIDQAKSEITVNFLTDKVTSEAIAKRLGDLGYPVNPNI